MSRLRATLRTMLYGVHIFPTEHSIQPGELARAAEQRGLESVWVSEHTHIPLRFLQGSGRGLPDYYGQTYDPFVALAHAAAVTDSIRLGTGVSLVIERDPIVLAKEVASLDRLSNGRFIFGVGAGWLKEEMNDHGVDYRTRFRLLCEQVRAMQAIWTSAQAEFHGRFVRFDQMRALPKPQQRPYPPIILGGSGGKALECAVAVGDGWAPWLLPAEQRQGMIAELRRLAAEAGRDPDALEVSLFEEAVPDARETAKMAALGVRRVIVTLLGNGRDESLPVLDALAAAAQRAA